MGFFEYLVSFELILESRELLYWAFSAPNPIVMRGDIIIVYPKLPHANPKIVVTTRMNFLILTTLAPLTCDDIDRTPRLHPGRYCGHRQRNPDCAV